MIVNGALPELILNLFDQVSDLVFGLLELPSDPLPTDDILDKDHGLAEWGEFTEELLISK